MNKEKQLLKHLKTNELNISFGLLYGSLSDQIKAQKFKFDKLEISKFEDQRRAIYQLHFGNIISLSQKDKMLIKLMKNLSKHVKSKNKHL